MFSYLRPHRRTPSNPTSPIPELSHSWEPPLHSSGDHTHPPRFQDASPQEPPASPPPSLPPISRVSALYEIPPLESNDETKRPRVLERDPRTQHWEASKGNQRSRETQTASNYQRIPYTEAQAPDAAWNAAATNYQSSQHTGPQSGMSYEVVSRPKPPHSNLPPIQTGRWPTGARLTTPPPGASSTISTFEPINTRSGKARLNLLNPMSLLARRRTQAVGQLSGEPDISRLAGNNYSDTFDPRIRGTVVHDFSAPRPRKTVSNNDVRSGDNAVRNYRRTPSGQGGDGDLVTIDDTTGSLRSGGNHAPIFTENFDEEQFYAAGAHVRGESDLTDLPLPKPPYAKGAPKAPDLHQFARDMDLVQKQTLATRRASSRKAVPDIGPPVPPKAGSRPLSEPRHISIDPSSTVQIASSSSRKGLSRTTSGGSAKDALAFGLPKHMKSTSSRFSFDMIGAAEQERLLEDRHRQKALEKKNGNTAGDELDDNDDNYDYDIMDDDDGLEERIPGVNADADYDESYDDGLEESIPGINADDDPENPLGVLDDNANLLGFSFQQSSFTSPLSPSTPNMLSTPRDANGEVIGFALTKNSPYLQTPIVQHSTSSPASPASSYPNVQGLGLQRVHSGPHITSRMQHFSGADSEDVETEEFPTSTPLIDDDLYFDDGIIEPLSEGVNTVEFDESVFDNVDTDEYGRPLQPLSTLRPLRKHPSTRKADTSLYFDTEPRPEYIGKLPKIDKDLPDVISPETIPVDSALAPRPSIAEKNMATVTTMPEPSYGLTQDTLAAYQSALAAAACMAAANGKFRRDSNPTNPFSIPFEQQDTHPGLTTDSNEPSRYEPFSSPYEDDFDYDDALEDDAIIAAANAEALANDSDGFYGQEFGFYSTPAIGEAEYANGGYFGPRGAEGINRTQSGRIMSREPNLTPITERSEYSNRNSFMSLPIHGYPGSMGSIGSPGLSQLAGMLSTHEYEGDMSLDALLKLRRGAWGGSQASLHSSNGSPRSAGGADETSPVGQLPPWAQSGAVSNHMTGLGGHRRQNSVFSLVSEPASAVGAGTGVVSENSSAPGSPTLTMAATFLDGSKKADEKDKGIRKHRSTSSAESISYSKADDPVAGERWILERRRTADSGEVEFLGREVVSRGRI